MNISLKSQIRLLLLALCVVLAGCKNKTGEQKEELVFLCGSSFVKPVETLCSEFTALTDIPISIVVAGSEDFLPMIKLGKQGDVIITHDPYLGYVTELGQAAGSVQTGFVAPVLVVQRGNPKGISSIDDLTKDGLKIALSNPEYSTCGEMVLELLKKKGIEEAVMKNVGNRLTKGHSNLGNLVKTQIVDAVMMWNGVATVFGDELEIVEVPYEYDSEIRVHIIGLGYSSYPQEVERFIKFAGERGKTVFTEFGYTK
jgi:molybdate transport system substrate-binding protein